MIADFLHFEDISDFTCTEQTRKFQLRKFSSDHKNKQNKHNYRKHDASDDNIMDIALLSYSEPEEIMDSDYGSESFSDAEDRESYRSESV